MKKMLLSLAAILALAGSSLAFASDSSDLAKEQKTAAKMLEIYDGAPVPAYSELSGLLSPELQAKFGDKQYAELRKQITEKFGTMKESKFVAYERFDKADRLTYFGTYTKEKVVVMVFGFNKEGKLIDFVVTPAKAQEKQENKAAAK